MHRGHDQPLAGDDLGARTDDDPSPGLDIGVAGLPDPCDPAVFDPDVGLDDPRPVQDQALVMTKDPGDRQTTSRSLRCARLSAEDLDDIAAGDTPLGAVQAFEQAAVAREAEDLLEHFEGPPARRSIDSVIAPSGSVLLRS